MAAEDLLQVGHLVKERWKVVSSDHFNRRILLQQHWNGLSAWFGVKFGSFQNCDWGAFATNANYGRKLLIKLDRIGCT